MISYYSPSKVRFSALGDWGAPTISQDRVLSVLHHLRNGLDFCVLLGDNFYPDGVTCVEDPRWYQDVVRHFPPSLRLYSILGNHDYHSNAHAQVLYTFHPPNKIWKMPYYYYAEEFPVGNDKLQMLFLDTAILAPEFTVDIMSRCGVEAFRLHAFRKHAEMHREKHIRWLHKQLSTGDYRWKVVCGHYPIVSNGPHEVCNVLHRLLSPLFQEYGVHLYLSGHDHNAQVLQEGTVCCVVAGGVSMTVPPPRRVPHTLFASIVPGQFVVEATYSHLTLTYVDGSNRVVFEHSVNAGRARGNDEFVFV